MPGSGLEQGECLGDVGVVAGGQVLGGAGDVIVGGDPDPVDELVVSADHVLGREGELAAVVQRPPCCGAGDDAGRAGADQGTQVQVLDRPAEHFAAGDAVPVGEHRQGQV